MVLKACEKAKPSSTEVDGGSGTQQPSGSNGSTAVNGETSQIQNGYSEHEPPPKKVGDIGIYRDHCLITSTNSLPSF